MNFDTLDVALLSELSLLQDGFRNMLGVSVVSGHYSTESIQYLRYMTITINENVSDDDRIDITIEINKDGNDFLTFGRILENRGVLDVETPKILIRNDDDISVATATLKEFLTNNRAAINQAIKSKITSS